MVEFLIVVAFLSAIGYVVYRKVNGQPILPWSKKK